MADKEICQCCKKRPLLKLAIYEGKPPLLVCDICDSDDLIRSITNNED